jgi:hypothetical protein
MACPATAGPACPQPNSAVCLASQLPGGIKTALALAHLSEDELVRKAGAELASRRAKRQPGTPPLWTRSRTPAPPPESAPDPSSPPVAENAISP